MAAIRKRPKDCTHSTCQSGECGKCPYNPHSGYSPYHVVTDPNGKGGIQLPLWLALVVGVGSGAAALEVYSACGCLGIAAMLVPVAVVASLVTILEFRA